MIRNAPNCTPKRTNPAAREMAKVWIVVPTLVWAEPAAPSMMLVILGIIDYGIGVVVKPVRRSSRDARAVAETFQSCDALGNATRGRNMLDVVIVCLGKVSHLGRGDGASKLGLVPDSDVPLLGTLLLLGPD